MKIYSLGEGSYRTSRANVGICYVTFDDRAKSYNTTMHVFMLTDLYMINILNTFTGRRSSSLPRSKKRGNFHHSDPLPYT